MKFRRSAVTITIYLLFTLLWMALFINASEEKNTKEGNADSPSPRSRRRCPRSLLCIPANIIQDNEIAQNLQQKEVRCLKKHFKKEDLQPKVNTMRLLHLIKAHILSTIFNELLTIHEILILRKTCTNFQNLLFPNDENMVIFCKNFSSKENDDVPLIWSDLKYFLNESYKNGLENMEMFTLKENQYAIFTRDQKIISWHNEQALHLYPKMILSKIKNEISQLPLLLDYELPKIYTKDGDAWAKITNEGNVITGGDAFYGGDSNHVQFKLKNVKMVASTNTAFAALLENGNVVTWGNEDEGGKIPEPIENQLKNVKMLYSNLYAFAALLYDNCVVVWGNQYREGGQISESIQAQLQNVKTIFSNQQAFAALLYDGQVIVWGDQFSGGKIPEHLIQPLLQKKVKMIFSNDFGFAALLKNGDIIAWGKSGGKMAKPIKCGANTLKTIFSSSLAFTALSHDGSVFAWGNSVGQIPHHIQTQLYQNVKMVYSNDAAFVAQLKDGRFLAWGDENHGGKITVEIKTKLENNVKAIFSSFAAFAALLDDGSVFTWGHPRCGGIISKEIQSKLIKNVKTIFPHKNGFIALCNDGELIPWGECDQKLDL